MRQPHAGVSAARSKSSAVCREALEQVGNGPIIAFLFSLAFQPRFSLMEAPMNPDTLLGILILSMILLPTACMAWGDFRKARRLARVKQNRRHYLGAVRP
jgi:hypothetical protein